MNIKDLPIGEYRELSKKELFDLNGFWKTPQKRMTNQN